MTATSAATSSGRPRDTLGSVAARVATLGTGERAALRRLFLTREARADGIVIGLLVASGAPDGSWAHPQAFERWRLLAHVAALLSGTGGRPAHSPERPLGSALANVRYSENRLMRLVSTSGPALIDQIVRMARVLAAASGGPVDLRDVRDLADPRGAEAARLRIARDYYRARDFKDRKDAR